MIDFKKTIVHKKATLAPIQFTKTIRVGKTQKYVGSFYKPIIKLS